MTHYEVLGVATSATTEELRAAYVGLARRHHPDVVGGDPARMRAINDAWSTLGDPDRRARYDATLRAVRSAEATGSTGWRARPAHVAPDPDLDGWGLIDPDDADLLADLADDEPIGGTVRLPRWYALTAPALVVLGLASVAVGAVVGLVGIVAIGAAALLGSAVLFLAAPMVAMAWSRRRDL